MSDLLAPGVYVTEEGSGNRTIRGVGTNVTAFIGVAPDAGARRDECVDIQSWSQFERIYAEETKAHTPLALAVDGYFKNRGREAVVVNIGRSDAPLAEALERLSARDEVSIVTAPGRADFADYDEMIRHCEEMEDRIAILDPPESVQDLRAFSEGGDVPGDPQSGGAAATPTDEADDGAAADEGHSLARPAQTVGVRPRASDYAALYYPWLKVPDPFSKSKNDDAVPAPPSGHVAGVYARTDAARGVHKAPANAVVIGATALTRALSKQDQANLNSWGVNCIVKKGGPFGDIRVWGARTLADPTGDFLYVPVRRLFLYLKESIAESTNWIVFEPNDYRLWKSIEATVTQFLTDCHRKGMLMGRTPEEAFFVKCDDETNPQESIDRGRVTCIIGVATLKPAEFVMFTITQTERGAEAALV